ncbi:MAG: alpha/beta fold hydrolase [Lewinellaceae bacterium]|nr:alpha/beta fold hydrolase [Lewinellaceae bacterium]
MPILDGTSYRPPWYLPSGHLQTLYPYFFRKVRPEYMRERITLPDGDFVDLDSLRQHSKNLAFLCHGLEGDSSSQYIRGMADFLYRRGWDVIALNFRSCSGEPNRVLQSYHHGEIRDLTYLLEQLNASGEYHRIVPIGFSLGGNVVLKYLGSHGEQLPDTIHGGIAVSVPTDLLSSSRRLDQWDNWIYTRRFRMNLKEKFEAKDRLFPGVLDMHRWNEVKRWEDFDNTYTSKIFGFRDAYAYYEQGSANNFLQGLRRPTLLINALNDPFLETPSYPYERAKDSRFLHLLTPKEGGHVGFPLAGTTETWEERVAWEFIQEYLA